MNPCLAIVSWSSVGLRAAIIVVGLVLWHWTQSLIARKAAAAGGIGDVIHDLTAGWHRYFATHDRAANAALIEFVADWLGVRKSAVSIVSGEKARHKRVQVAGLTVEAVRRKLPAQP